MCDNGSKSGVFAFTHPPSRAMDRQNATSFTDKQVAVTETTKRVDEGNETTNDNAAIQPQSTYFTQMVNKGLNIDSILSMLPPRVAKLFRVYSFKGFGLVFIKPITR